MRFRSRLLHVVWSCALFFGSRGDGAHRTPQDLMERAAKTASVAWSDSSLITLGSLCLWDRMEEAREARATGPLNQEDPGDAAEGVFRLLTYNIAALPHWISPSQPLHNVPRIGPLLNHYDLALVQEDFSYHTTLVRDVRHPFRSPPLSPRFLMNDGLNHFSNRPIGTVQRVRWRACHGWLRYANDCLADKGFSVATMALSRQAHVDVYNLHAEAGEAAGDIAARRDNFEQLAAFIARRSPQRAIIVAGDLNTSTPEDMRMLDGFLRQTGLRDVCRELRCDDEHIDRVLIRSSAQLALHSLGWAVDARFVDDAGIDLSDHKAIGVQLGWRKLP